MAKRKESTLKLALRSMLADGKDIYPSTVAETYGSSVETVNEYMLQLRFEGLCERGGVYYTFTPKGAPIKRHWYASRATPKPVPDTDEQPRADHPNVTFMKMYM